ncbi:MAG: glutamate racemase [Rickettsiales bacterium]
MIIVDSGLGGISVVRALKGTHASRPLTYIADTAGFPYGKRSPENITERAISLITKIKEHHDENPIVIACNTLSTLSLDQLRAHFPATPFVGTVPAIKPAAAATTTRRLTLLATPNTAASKYSSALVEQFAADCVVDSYGAPNLAAIVEAHLLGTTLDDDTLRNELEPAFHDDASGKTDCIVLGCTHYPLIVGALSRVAPWPVTFVDSSAAIARRALSLADTQPNRSTAYVTAKTDVTRYKEVFLREGFETVEALTFS